MRELAEALGIDTVMDGTNADDLQAYRPGLQALKELGIISPLAEAGLTKIEVRQLAKEYNLAAADQPSTPCLATRFHYGTVLVPEELEKVAAGEEYLRSLGFYNVRLRVHGDIARIEVDSVDMQVLLQYRQEVARHLRGLGFTYVTLDMDGFRSGSMDQRTS